MQWLDIEKSEADKRYVTETGCSSRERWQHMVEAKKEENAKSNKRKFAFSMR
jgi:hypothetical protein